MPRNFLRPCAFFFLSLITSFRPRTPRLVNGAKSHAGGALSRSWDHCGNDILSPYISFLVLVFLFNASIYCFLGDIAPSCTVASFHHLDRVSFRIALAPWSSLQTVIQSARHVRSSSFQKDIRSVRSTYFSLRRVTLTVRVRASLCSPPVDPCVFRRKDIEPALILHHTC